MRHCEETQSISLDSNARYQQSNIYPEATPPVRGAPVSPPAMARMEVENAARDWRDERRAGRTALEMDCRYMVVDFAWEQLMIQRGS